MRVYRIFLFFFILLGFSACSFKSSFSGGASMSLSTSTSILQKIVLGGPANGLKGFSCGITNDARVLCWGLNDNGQLGVGDFEEIHYEPQYVQGGEQGGAFLSNIVDLAAGHSNTCAIDSSGATYCWGRGLALGNGLGTDSSLPVRVSSGEQNHASGFFSDAVEVSVGFTYVCARTQSNEVYCWGAGGNGRLGGGSTASASLPQQVLGGEQGGSYLNSIRQVDTGRATTCAITMSDELYCWGDTRGVGVNETSGNVLEPRQVYGGEQGGAFLSQVESVSLGWNRTCVLIKDGSVYCWGDDISGYLGVGPNPENTYVPSRVLGGDQGGTYLENIVDINYGFAHGCASASDGKLYCWGWAQDNVPREIAAGDQSEELEEEDVSFKNVKHMILGPSFSCFLDEAHIAYCNGSNATGQLGVGESASSTYWAPYALGF